MPSDWIKLRADISRDPRVIAIADALAESRPFMDWLTGSFGPSAACRESAYERVTRCVTVSVTVTALVRIWSLARTQGRARGDDVYLDFATLTTLDVIAEVPDFGRAMASVGWVEEQPGRSGVMFPKFLRQNTTPEERRKEQAAARKQRQRARDKSVTERDAVRDGERDKSVTCHANVTHREEKRREEENTPQPPVKTGGESVAFRPPRFEEVRQAWDSLPNVVKTVHASDVVRRQFGARCMEPLFCENWRKGIEAVSRSPRCQGEGGSGWRATLKWFLKSGTLEDLLNGEWDSPGPVAAKDEPIRMNPLALER